MDENIYKRRITNEDYNNIFNDISKISDIDKLTFDMNIDMVCELLCNVDNKRGWNVQIVKEKITFAFINYLFKILNSYHKLLTGSHRISVFIINRTIIEVCLKLKWLLYKDDEKLYLDFIKDSLVSEKLYLDDIINYPEISDKFKEGTRQSIYRLQKDSNIDDLSELSRKKIAFPNIEKMVNELKDVGLVPKATYEIVYRTYSNFAHANWSAIQIQAFRENADDVDTRVMAPNALLIIDLFLYINKIFSNINPSFLKDLEIYYKAFYILNDEYLSRIGSS